MVHEKKRTPGSVERHTGNRAENETRHALNVVRLEDMGRGPGTYRERPSRVLRAVKRAERFADQPGGGDAA